MGCEIYIITTRKKGVPTYEEEGGIRVFRVSTPYNVKGISKFLELDKKIGIDIVNAHGTACISYALLRSFMKRKPYLIHVHDTTAGAMKWGEYLPFTVTPIDAIRDMYLMRTTLARQKIMWRRADLLIAVCNSLARELHELYSIPKNKIRVAYNGVDVDFFHPVTEDYKQIIRGKLGIEGAPVILYVGSLTQRKGPHYLLRAIPQILKRFPKATFVFLGGVPAFLRTKVHLRLWHDIIRTTGIQKHVLLVGEVKHREVLNFYAAADIFVLPTLYEGLPKATLEAMASGLPVVTTNVSGNPELVLNGKTGFTVQPRDINQLANAIIDILSDQGLLKTMGFEARRRVEEQFNWRKTAEKIMEIYNEALRLYC